MARWINLVTACSSKLRALCYPPLCLHCNALLSAPIPLLCSLCLSQLELSSLEGRCLTCLAPASQGRCTRCASRPRRVYRQVVACEPLGPVMSLVNAMRSEHRAAAQALAALMSYQWLHHSLPLPSLIIPMPGSGWCAYNPHALLARIISSSWGVPSRRVLRNRWDTQAFWSDARFQSRPEPKGAPLTDQVVLLVGVQLEDRVIQAAALALEPLFPRAIYSLSAIGERVD